MSTDIFKAILAMDSYNRGYGAGINLTGTQVGAASILKDSSVLTDGEQRLDQPAGFYAIAYQEADGGVTISYRGTDDPTIFSLSGDIWSGWMTGSGIQNTDQADLAFQFYKTAANANELVSETTIFHERCAA